MMISKEKLNEIMKSHSMYIMDADDAEHAFMFVWDLLCAETDALKKNAPYAHASISKLESAEYEVFDLMGDVVDALEESES